MPSNKKKNSSTRRATRSPGNSFTQAVSMGAGYDMTTCLLVACFTLLCVIFALAAFLQYGR
jgi:hypothetical protein